MNAKATRFFPARLFKDICYSSAFGCGLTSCEYLMNSTPSPCAPYRRVLSPPLPGSGAGGGGGRPRAG